MAIKDLAGVDKPKLNEALKVVKDWLELFTENNHSGHCCTSFSLRKKNMKAFILLLLLAASSNSEVFYVTSELIDNYQCVVNGTTLDQCYTLQQLVNSSLLSSFYSQQLVFLPGKHELPESQTLKANGHRMTLNSWNNSQDVLIECQQNTNIILRQFVEIFSLHFKYCTLQFVHGVQIAMISNCIFEKSRTYAVIVRSHPLRSDLVISISNCTFLSNTGAVYANDIGHVNSQIHMFLIVLMKNTKFQDNWSTNVDHFGQGGAVFLEGVRAEVSNSHFVNNSAISGGAIFGQSSILKVSDAHFHMNSALGNGSSINLFDSDLELISCSFINNSAGKHGGGLAVFNAMEVSIHQCIFEGNDANRNGGGLYVVSSWTSTITSCEFMRNSASAGGALYIQSAVIQSNWEMSRVDFAANKARYHNGGAVYCSGGRINLSRGHAFLNSAKEGNGGFAFLENCPLSTSYSFLLIRNNSASYGGAVYTSHQSDFRFISSTILLIDNAALKNGGALYLKNSIMYAANNVSIVFHFNVAFGKGGAMYVVDSNCEETPQCFLQNFESLLFANNSAKEGSILYGGLLDRCQEGQKHGIIAHVKKISEYEPTPLAITSDPVKVCLCDKNQSITCALRDVALNKMRGEKFELVGIVVDQDENPKESFVRARYLEQDTHLDKKEAGEEVGTACQIFSFHVFTQSTTATLALQPEGFCELSEESRITVNITILPCARGLEISGDRCICEERLRSVTFSDVTCSVGNDSIETEQPIWLRYDKDYLLVHTHCPLDYCQAMLNTISLAFPDQQCANNRSGVVCGACQENYSIGLGGSKCLKCTSMYAYIWLLPVFAMAGIALVALLLVCNMTISQGTLNGLIFYANVVSIAGLTSLQNCSIHPILSVFIAWVNLDFGVETCFFFGMNMYQKTWLQFVFPLYIWLLVGVIIVASYYSSTAMKIFGRSNVAVLTTLFLLSYTKFLKTIIATLQFTEVLRGSAHNLSDQLMPYKVWIYDGNIEYLKGKHVPLFTTALIMLIVLFIPYTLLLTFGHWLRSKRSWLTQSTFFISIMDAYHAPYRLKHRYWTGLMLLTRCILFLAFASSYSNNQILTNMYITTLVLIGIFTLKMTYASQVYKSLFLSLFELSFLLNLIILSATLYYIGGSSSNDGPICKCTSASIAVSFVLFVGIFTYHAYLRAEKIQWLKSINRRVLSKRFLKHCLNPATTDVNRDVTNSIPTTSNIELREILLASDKF